MRMRIFPALTAALLLVAGAATPALAGGGLPVLTSLKAGTAEATLYGDSLFLHPGTNTISVEMTGVAEGARVALRLIGPHGQMVEVPLSTLHVVEGPADAHGGHGDTTADAHGATDSHGGHGAAPAENALWLRGKATLPAPGAYKLQLDINGKTATDQLKAVANGPSPLYLGITGAAMGGTILYGAVMRRKQGRS